MRKESVRHSGALNGTSVNFFPERPKQVENKNKEEFVMGTIRFYKIDGKTFDADTYDKMFNRESAIGKVKPQNGPKKADIDPRTGRTSRSKSRARKIK